VSDASDAVLFDAVLFDFNGVLTTSPFAHMAQLGEDHGVGGQAVLEILLGPYDEDTDHPWHRYERGEITGSEYGIDLMTRAQKQGMEVDFTVLAGLMGKLVVHDVVLDRIRALRTEGYRTGLVTNNVKEASDTWRAMVPLDELFDCVVDSSEVGMRKPNPAIYLHALELLEVAEPGRAIFLDDAPGNVVGAERAGLAAILVDSDQPELALAELESLLAADPTVP
jgi:putative hydrolase of the HAD superfamily